MRIALVSTLATPVRRDCGGSVESLIWLLARELTQLGHEVTTFGATGSDSTGETVPTLPAYSGPDALHDWLLAEWVNLCRAAEQSHRFDVIHSHAYLLGIPLQRLSRAPMLHTMHTMPYENERRLWSLEPRSHVTAISHHQWAGFPAARPEAVIYHGLDPEQFRFHAQPGDYLLYLGRFMGGKGPLHAIQIAGHLGMRLLLAGPPNGYFRKVIEPLVDGRTVEYVGYVGGREKVDLLGGARALLYPVQSPEPFGLVLIEAMLCGTPVVATRLGAAPEVIEEGVTGYCANSLEDFPDQVLSGFQLNRQKIRERAVGRFSANRMAREYLRVYEHIVQHSEKRTG